MKLNDIGNMEYYLKNDCYCPGEIYDITGFFFQVFDKDDECIEIGRKEGEATEIISVVCKNQILNFWIDGNYIVDAQRCDATENNIKIIKMFLANISLEGMKLDEFENGSTSKTLSELMSQVDVIII